MTDHAEFPVAPVTQVAVDWPVLHPKNPRRGDVDAIVAMIKANGWHGVIVVQASTRFVLVGNHRLQAARKLGMTHVPAMVVDVDDDRALRILLADNRASDLAENDDRVMFDLLSVLVNTAEQLDGTGYDADYLADLLVDLADPPPKGEDVVPPARQTAVSVAGEVYELGPHRLVCGDACGDAVARAVGDAKARMLWTDPPYGISIIGGSRAESNKDRLAAGALTIQNDGADGLPVLLRDAFARVVGSLEPGSPFYVAAPAGTRFLDFEVAIKNADWRLHQILVWVKDAFVLGHSDYHYAHEMILYGWTPGAGRSGRGAHAGSRWFGDNKQTSVLSFPRPRRSEDHPTMKPVELIEYCILNSSRAGDLVLDSFGGSGSTLIACAKTGRRAALVEIDPVYCDVIRRRWTTYATSAGISTGPGALAS